MKDVAWFRIKLSTRNQHVFNCWDSTCNSDPLLRGIYFLLSGISIDMCYLLTSVLHFSMLKLVFTMDSEGYLSLSNFTYFCMFPFTLGDG